MNLPPPLKYFIYSYFDMYCECTYLMCRHIGVVAVDVRLSDLEQILFSQQWGSLYSFVINEEGEVIIHPRLTPAAEVQHAHVCIRVLQYTSMVIWGLLTLQLIIILLLINNYNYMYYR